MPVRRMHVLQVAQDQVAQLCASAGLAQPTPAIRASALATAVRRARRAGGVAPNDIPAILQAYNAARRATPLLHRACAELLCDMIMRRHWEAAQQLVEWAGLKHGATATKTQKQLIVAGLDSLARAAASAAQVLHTARHRQPAARSQAQQDLQQAQQLAVQLLECAAHGVQLSEPMLRAAAAVWSATGLPPSVPGTATLSSSSAHDNASASLAAGVLAAGGSNTRPRAVPRPSKAPADGEPASGATELHNAELATLVPFDWLEHVNLDASLAALTGAVRANGTLRSKTLPSSARSSHSVDARALAAAQLPKSVRPVLELLASAQQVAAREGRPGIAGSTAASFVALAARVGGVVAVRATISALPEHVRCNPEAISAVARACARLGQAGAGLQLASALAAERGCALESRAVVAALVPAAAAKAAYSAVGIGHAAQRAGVVLSTRAARIITAAAGHLPPSAPVQVGLTDMGTGQVAQVPSTQDADLSSLPLLPAWGDLAVVDERASAPTTAWSTSIRSASSMPSCLVGHASTVEQQLCGLGIAGKKQELHGIADGLLDQLHQRGELPSRAQAAGIVRGFAAARDPVAALHWAAAAIEAAQQRGETLPLPESALRTVVASVYTWRDLRCAVGAAALCASLGRAPSPAMQAALSRAAGRAAASREPLPAAAVKAAVLRADSSGLSRWSALLGLSATPARASRSESGAIPAALSKAHADAATLANSVVEWVMSAISHAVAAGRVAGVTPPAPALLGHLAVLRLPAAGQLSLPAHTEDSAFPAAGAGSGIADALSSQERQAAIVSELAAALTAATELLHLTLSEWPVSEVAHAAAAEAAVARTPLAADKAQHARVAAADRRGVGTVAKHVARRGVPARPLELPREFGPARGPVRGENVVLARTGFDLFRPRAGVRVQLAGSEQHAEHDNELDDHWSIGYGTTDGSVAHGYVADLPRTRYARAGASHAGVDRA